LGEFTALPPDLAGFGRPLCGRDEKEREVMKEDGREGKKRGDVKRGGEARKMGRKEKEGKTRVLGPLLTKS